MNTSNKLATVFVAVVLTATTGVATAHHRSDGLQRYYEQGRVLRVKPIYRTVTVPVQERRCRDRRHHHRRNNTSQTIAGGILGGIIGNQFGQDDGKVAMTIVGSILGAVIANEATDNRRHRAHRHDHRCKVVTSYREKRKLVGYRVKYRYRGETYWTRTKRDPGRYINVRHGRRYMASN